MISIRPLTEQDAPVIQRAIDADTFHQGEWRLEHFLPAKPSITTTVIEDQAGPITFVRFTKTLRIECVWVDGADNSRNAKAIIHGIQDAVVKARESGFSEIIITTTHPKLAQFFERILGMTRRSDEYVLAV